MGKLVRILSLALVLTLAVALPGSASAKETIQFYAWSSEQAALYEEVLNLFHSTQDEVQVELTWTPYEEYWTKLQTSIPAGNGPDAFVVSTSRYNIYRDAGGLMENLSPYLERDGLTLDHLDDSILNMIDGDGSIYMIPKDCDSIGLFYNKGIFDAAGEPYPTADWTWDDMFAAAQRLTNPNEGVWGCAISTADDTGYVPYLRSYDGYFVDPDRVTPTATKPVIAERLAIWRQLIRDGVSPDVPTVDEIGGDQLFINGQIALFVDGCWQLAPYYEAMTADVLGLSPVPKGSDHRDSTSGSTGFSISPTSTKKEAAWKFVSFLGTPEAIGVMAKYNLSPYPEYAVGWTENFPGVDAQVLIDAISYSSDPADAESREMCMAFEDAVSRALTTDEDIPTILQDIQAQMEAIINRAN